MLQREYFVRELEREWAQVETEEKKVVAEWVSIEDAQKEYIKKREAFEKTARARFNFLPPDDVIAFNVGGQLFKSTVKVWTRDRFSILAQLCTTKPKLPKLCAEDDAFFFDRDFWIFQFIYAFLRDNSLPSSVDVLCELYCEASFYRIGLLRHAIESKMMGEDAMATSVLASAASTSSSSYEGGVEFGRYCGHGVLQLADGNRYEGEFLNGQFHGRGTLYFPEGRLEGAWENGKKIDGTFIFSDGLEYAPDEWAYCSGADRRYFSETISTQGIRAAGELNYFDTGINRVVPLGCYDAGNGIFAPSTGQVSAYTNPSETREPSDDEKRWITSRAPKASTKDMSVN
ncbi:hypothetical protein PybrP1_006417 [[Pythium] brassicae (nom. inval.)]|nr:hypothetical protein PybrP1_006417 [[Pythium] brassicae (nom. inval.)]